MLKQLQKVWHALRHSLDDPTTDLTDESIFGDGLRTATGESINLVKAIGYPALRQAVTIISGDVAKYPFEPRSLNPDGTTEVDRDDPLYTVTAWMPNDEMDAFNFWRHLMIHAVIFTHGYAVIIRDAATQVVVEMLPLLSDRTHLEIVGDRKLYVSEIGGRLRTFFPSEIFHLKGMCTGDGDDCEMLKDCRNTIALGLAGQNFASRFFRRGGRIGGVLEVPAQMTKKSKDTLEEGFTKSYDDPNAQFRTIVLRDNAKFHAAQFDPEKAQMVEGREFEVKEAARITNLIPSKLGDSSRTAYNTLEMEEKFYQTSSLSHWFMAMRGEARVKLLTPTQRDNRTHDVIHDTTVFLDAETRAKVGEKEIMMGVTSPNEYRVKMLKEPPRPGGDEFLTPMNMTSVTPPPAREAERSLADAARAPFKEAINRSIRRSIATLRREVKQKPAPRFCDWVDGTARDQLLDDMAEELGESARGMSIVCKMTTQNLVSEVSRAFIDPLLAEVNKSLDTIADVDDLRSEVNLIADRHSKRQDDLFSLFEVRDEKATSAA